MVGIERTIIPELGESVFGISGKTAILAFIVAFGISKAFANYFTGALSDRVGRKNLLTVGWFIALPVPVILMKAGAWEWVIFSNVLLGISQGLTWSSTVVMKIDLVGQKDRGLAMGLNEAAGYMAVGVLAFVTGWLATSYGIRPYPFYLGIGIAVVGFLSSLFLVKDTHVLVKKEVPESGSTMHSNVFTQTSFLDPNLSSITQAGFVNNLNDGMMWGLLPLILASKGFDLKEIGIIAGIYPAVWGISQLATGKMADHYSNKNMLIIGMAMQGIAILFLAWVNTFEAYIIISVILGLGTALVYPTFLVAISNLTHPSQRAPSIGIFRLWRDLGYAAGALSTGIIADKFGIPHAVIFIGLITIASSFVILFRMQKISQS